MSTFNADSPRALSNLLMDLKGGLNKPNVTVDELLEAFHERGFGFFLFLLALAAALPLPPVGIKTIIGVPLLILTIQQALGRHKIWVPEKFRTRAIASSTIDKFIDTALPYILKGERFIKPRLGFLTHGVFSHLIGVAGTIMALAVLIPFPLTNTVPSFGIAMMAVGVMARDGLALIVGAVVGVVWVSVLTFAVLYFGMEGFDIVKDTIKSWL